MGVMIPVAVLDTVETVIDRALTHIVVSPPMMKLAEGATSFDPISGFLQYGVLGLVVIGYATGWIVPGPQAKALAAENARLSSLIENKLFPMFEQYAGTMERAAIALEKSAEAMDRQAERERLASYQAQREQT